MKLIPSYEATVKRIDPCERRGVTEEHAINKQKENQHNFWDFSLELQIFVLLKQLKPYGEAFLHQSTKALPVPIR